MAEQSQGILPMEVEISTYGRRPPRIARPKSGVQVQDPRADFFEETRGAARRDGSIAGVVSKVRHANIETGFYILEVVLDDGGQKVTFVGVSETVSVGDRVEATGSWERHAKYGHQLKARFIRVLAPSTGAEIHAFLVRGGVKGVGKKSADKLLETFGDKLVEVMESSTALMKAGISEKQAVALAEAWSRRTTQTETVAFLQALKIGPATTDKIIKKYGERTKQVITADPFVVAKEISGLGFKTADMMALQMGFEREDPRRIDAAVIHAMSMIARDGHCAAPKAQIENAVQKLIGAQRNHVVDDAIERLMQRRLLVEEESGGRKVIYDANVLKCEIELAERVMARKGEITLPDDIDATIMKVAGEVMEGEIHEHQAMAVRNSLASQFSVITGGPGSGKTSTLKVLLGVLEELKPGCRIGLAAPTGRAGQRMAESTGREARTIHRMLEWAPDRGGFQKGVDDPLDYDLVVLDEASMLDIWLARDVLRAVHPDASVIFVGDVDQLPSVGAGRVLGDVIDSGVVPVTKLTRIFRQENGSMIASCAHEINAGRMPSVGRPNKKTDMWALWDDDPDESLRKIVRLVGEVAPSLGYHPRRDVQVLTAGHNGTLGTTSLNLMLQEALNPETPDNPGVKVRDWTFRIGDRVIQTSNNYDLDVFNGDIGEVTAISAGEKRDTFIVTVSFDGRDVDFTGTEAKELSLAYAISVHKSQGSEFPFVVVTPSTQHSQMMKKTLLYTAVTRAKRICALVGQRKAAFLAVRNTDRSRVTGLHKRLTIGDAQARHAAGRD